MTTPTSLRPCALAAAAALALGAAGALAQTGPYSIGGSVGFHHDSNIYRLPDGVDPGGGRSRSDTVTTLSAIAGVDQTIGRQRLRGNLALRDNRYADNGQLDNRGYGANLALDWETVNNISGTVAFGADRSLASYETQGSGLERNLQDTHLLDIVARKGVVTRWTVEGGLRWRRTDYSLASFDYLDNHQTAVFGGVRYRPSSALDLGAALRLTEGRYPRFRALPGGGFAEDRFDRRDIDFTANWQPRGSSIYSARLSIGNTSYDQASQRDFSGLTGDLTWLWQATGKLTLRSSLVRDSGQDSSFFLTGQPVVVGFAPDGQPILGLAPVQGVRDFSRTTNALQLSASYAATAKIAVNAQAQLASRRVVRTDIAGGQAGADVSGRERLASFSLGATWAPTRTSQIGCELGHSRRNGDTLSADFGANSFGCFAQLTLQP